MEAPSGSGFGSYSTVLPLLVFLMFTPLQIFPPSFIYFFSLTYLFSLALFILFVGFTIIFPGVAPLLRGIG